MITATSVLPPAMTTTVAINSPNSTEFTAMMNTMLLPAMCVRRAVRLQEVVGVLENRPVVVQRAHESAFDAETMSTYSARSRFIASTYMRSSIEALADPELGEHPDDDRDAQDGDRVQREVSR